MNVVIDEVREVKIKEIFFYTSLTIKKNYVITDIKYRRLKRVVYRCED
jgi:hypothetical protein